MLAKKLCILILCLSTIYGLSQTKKRNFRQKEIGLFAGGSYYIGDLNPRGHFMFSKPACGAFFRYATSYRYAFRFGFNYGSVYASDSKSKDADQLERNLNFRSEIYDVHAIAEFNFVDYRLGNDNHYFTMFIFAGLGGYYFNPQSDMGKGYVDLRPLKTEGQSKVYPKYQINIPFGVGFKWHLTSIFGLGVEWGPRKLFTDYLDDVSSAYPISTSLYSGTGTTGFMRGNPRTKDWYFFYGVTLTMRLPKLKPTCIEIF